jgi:multidrug efflux pump subunit AcrB
VTHKSDDELVEKTHNTARYFTETRHVAWVLLVATLLWGLFAYWRMPKRKDPEIPLRFAVATCAWPGAPAKRVEELVTRKLESKLAENAHVEKLESVSRAGLSLVYVTIDERAKDVGKEFDDLKGKLDSIAKEMPDGAQPPDLMKDFADTTTLMLTVTTPNASDVDVALRARTIRRAIEEVRAEAAPEDRAGRAAFVLLFPQTMEASTIRELGPLIARFLADQRFAKDVRLLPPGPGYVGFDAKTDATDDQMLLAVRDFANSQIRVSELNPDIWLPPSIIRDPAQTEAVLAKNAGVKYSYAELDDFTERIQRALQAVPQVAKVSRTGVRDERVYLTFSQERLAQLGIQTTQLSQTVGARNIAIPGGVLEVDGKNLNIEPSGEFKNEKEIGDLILGASPSGSPVYLRDVVQISREYETPPRFLSFYRWKDHRGIFRRARAITVAVTMRSGEQVENFGKAVDKALEDVKLLLPEDLVIARTSDQAQQVRENVDLFMKTLYEAIALVIAVAFIGFLEWRSAVLIAFSIPLTLAMTFGMMQLCGVDIQQVSIASLIIALGLLVDDPVVAGDSIKREIGRGKARSIAAWLGPTKLAGAILFATITNVVAYLPYLTLSGDVGRFMWSLPVVLTCSLVASRLVSMSFVPMLGAWLLRAPKKPEPTLEEKRSRGFSKRYYNFVGWAIDHRWTFLAASFLVMGAMFAQAKKLKAAFFPGDLSYLS